MTPLQEALGAGDYNKIKKLLDDGEDPNEMCNGIPLICLALQENYFEIADLLVERGATIDAMVVKNRETPLLHCVVSIKNAKALKWALNKGLHPDIKDKYAGTTPLHMAAYIGNTDCARILVEHGGCINVTDNDKLTPLHCAAGKGQYDMVQFLLEHGADINAANKAGKTPLNYAVGNREIEQLLSDKGATKDSTNGGAHLVEKISEKITMALIFILLLIGLRKLLRFVFKHQ